MASDIPAADLRALDSSPLFALLWKDGDVDRIAWFYSLEHASSENEFFHCQYGRIYRRAPDTPEGWERVEGI